jgi:hypothetical protein
MNNKYAKNLRTMLALLPVEVCHVYRDIIYEAAAEIDRLDNALHGENYNASPKYPKPPAPSSPPSRSC